MTGHGWLLNCTSSAYRSAGSSSRRCRWYGYGRYGPKVRGGSHIAKYNTGNFVRNGAEDKHYKLFHALVLFHNFNTPGDERLDHSSRSSLHCDAATLN